MKQRPRVNALATKPLSGRAATALVSLMVALSLCGCALPDKPVRPSVYDFGPGALTSTQAASASLPPVVFAPVESSSALDNSALLYRLGYADARQVRPYAQARWSMPPAELLHRRLSERLTARRLVLTPVQAAGTLRTDGQPTPWQLRVDLDEFSQLYTSPQQSQGLVRLRATVTFTTQGQLQRRQQSFSAQRPAAQPDAVGGVRALTEATDAVIEELLAWMAGLPQ